MHFDTVLLRLMLHHLEGQMRDFIYWLRNAGDFFGLRQQAIVKTGNSNIFRNGDSFFLQAIDNIVCRNIVIN